MFPVIMHSEHPPAERWSPDHRPERRPGSFSPGGRPGSRML